MTQAQVVSELGEPLLLKSIKNVAERPTGDPREDEKRSQEFREKAEAAALVYRDMVVVLNMNGRVIRVREPTAPERERIASKIGGK